MDLAADEYNFHEARAKEELEKEEAWLSFPMQNANLWLTGSYLHSVFCIASEREGWFSRS